MKKRTMHASLAPACTKATLLASVAVPALAAAMSIATTSVQAACSGPSVPNQQTKCLTAVQIPGNPIRSFDISFVNTSRSEYYLSDRTNAGMQVLSTAGPTYLRTITGGAPSCTVSCSFQGIKPGPTSIAVNNNISGPDGTTSHGKWLYAGDGDSTLKVMDLTIPGPNAIVQSYSTGGSTRVDEMALTNNGKLLLVSNNAEDPPFATLFNANGDNANNTVSPIGKITVDPTIIVPGNGLSFEQPTWENTTQRFYESVPIIANNPPGCNYGQLTGPITCSGGVLVIDPTTVSGSTVLSSFNPTTQTGMIAIPSCGPNGATVGQRQNIMFGCNPGNVPFGITTFIMNVSAANSNRWSYNQVSNITGADEVWYNSGDLRYYLGASKDCSPSVPIAGSSAIVTTETPCAATAGGPPPSTQKPVLGVVDSTSVLIEKIPQGSNAHSVAADSTFNRIFVPQVGPTSVVGVGGDTTGNSALICGSTAGCIAVYQH
jgi:hypothetical protein